MKTLKISSSFEQFFVHQITDMFFPNQEEMNYKPVDINETGMNIDIMKKLAHCLILQANGELNV